jgi:lipid-binding SYLF domain-containing protein
MAGATDFAGDPRIANGVADMGAYEFSVLYACISGAVYYAGSQTGQIVVVAGAHTNTVASPSAYGIAGLSVPGSYGVSALWM